LTAATLTSDDLISIREMKEIMESFSYLQEAWARTITMEMHTYPHLQLEPQLQLDPQLHDIFSKLGCRRIASRLLELTGRLMRRPQPQRLLL
jgi:hypothetical protein